MDAEAPLALLRISPLPPDFRVSLGVRQFIRRLSSPSLASSPFACTLFAARTADSLQSRHSTCERDGACRCSGRSPSASLTRATDRPTRTTTKVAQAFRCQIRTEHHSKAVRARTLQRRVCRAQAAAARIRRRRASPRRTQVKEATLSHSSSSMDRPTLRQASRAFLRRARTAPRADSRTLLLPVLLARTPSTSSPVSLQI